MAVRAQDDEVLDVFVRTPIGPCTRSSNVVSPGGTRKRIARGTPAASRSAISEGVSARHVRSYIQPPPAAFGRLALRLQLLRPAVAVIRVARRTRRRGRRAVLRQTLALQVRRMGAADDRALVPVEAKPPQARRGCPSSMSADDRSASVSSMRRMNAPPCRRGEEPVEERRAGPSDVEVPGRRRRKTDADGCHGDGFYHPIGTDSNGRRAGEVCSPGRPRPTTWRPGGPAALIHAITDARSSSRSRAAPCRRAGSTFVPRAQREESGACPVRRLR